MAMGSTAGRPVSAEHSASSGTLASQDYVHNAVQYFKRIPQYLFGSWDCIYTQFIPQGSPSPLQVLTFPDKAMDSTVRQALAGLGIPYNTVFTEQIPARIGDTNLKIGLGEKSDDFLTVIRYAMPVDATRRDKWREDLPLVIPLQRPAETE